VAFASELFERKPKPFKCPNAIIARGSSNNASGSCVFGSFDPLQIQPLGDATIPWGLLYDESID
jgi:hypothetical protein